jgi:integrase
MSTPNQFSLTRLFEIYLELRQHDLSPSTTDIYKYAIRRLVESAGDVPAAAITPLAAMRFANDLAGRYPRRATVNMYLRAVKAFFRWLVAAEEIAKNPFVAVKNFRDTAAGKELYRRNEAAALLDACPDDRWRLIVALAMTTGMRRGEILNLTVGEIDFVGSLIRITPKTDTAATWAWSIKDAEMRQVPITPMLEKYLLRICAELPDGQPYVCLRPNRYRRLMAQKARGGTLKYATAKCPEINFLRTFTMICRHAGIAYKTFHAMRGSALSIMADNGLQPQDLKAIAGHSDFRTTYRHYVRPDAHLDKARNAAFMGGTGFGPVTSCL